MEVDVITRTVIRRHPDDVFAYAGDPTNAPAWYSNIRSVSWQTAPPLAVGSRLEFVADFAGRQLTYTYEVRDFEPGRRLVMATTEGPFPMETTYVWEPAGDGGTQMTLRNRGRPSGFSRLLTPFLAGAVRDANRRDLARLKALLEAPHPPA